MTSLKTKKIQKIPKNLKPRGVTKLLKNWLRNACSPYGADHFFRDRRPPRPLRDPLSGLGGLPPKNPVFSYFLRYSLFFFLFSCPCPVNNSIMFSNENLFYKKKKRLLLSKIIYFIKKWGFGVRGSRGVRGRH